jgi:SPP1 gp7 family putative phage head morphogenesis protein
MADHAHNETDKLLEQMEKRISAIYAEAQVEMRKKAEAYFDAFIAEGDRKLKLVKAGKLSEAEYQKWVKNKIAYGKRFDQFKRQYAEAMSHVNEIAAAYINDQLPDIYALNYNGAGEDIASQVGGYSFTMADVNTVKNLATRDTTLLPYKYIDGKKDVRWNTQKVNAAITQGILQGESIPNIAKRLSKNIPEMNKASAIRNARTATTGAECAGRQSQYEDATRRGIQLQREWIAAIDMRTRHAHRLLDGQLADVDKPFESELGDIMFPGDPEAHPANVYNCRCTVAAKVMGFEKTNKGFSAGGVGVIK